MGLFLLKGCADYSVISGGDFNKTKEDVYKNIFVEFRYEATTDNLFGGKLNGISLPKPYIKIFNGESYEKNKSDGYCKNSCLFNNCCYFLERDYTNSD